MLLRWHLLCVWRHVLCIFRARAVEDSVERVDTAPPAADTAGTVLPVAVDIGLMAAAGTAPRAAVDTVELAFHTARPGDTVGIEDIGLMAAVVDSQQEDTVLAACLAGLAGLWYEATVEARLRRLLPACQQ